MLIHFLIFPTSPGEQTELNTRLFSVHRIELWGFFLTSLLPVQGDQQTCVFEHGTPLLQQCLPLVRPSALQE